MAKQKPRPPGYPMMTQFMMRSLRDVIHAADDGKKAPRRDYSGRALAALGLVQRQPRKDGLGWLPTEKGRALWESSVRFLV